MELGGKVMLTHLQKLITIMFGVPFTAQFALTYSAAILESSSLNHKTPLCWYRPCLLSGNVPLLLMRSACH